MRLIPYSFLGGFLAVTAAIAVIVLVAAAVKRRRERCLRECRRALWDPPGRDSDEALLRRIRRQPFLVLRAYANTLSAVQPPEEHQRHIESILLQAGVDILLVRDLSRGGTFRHARAALYLAYLPSTAGARALDLALRRKRSSVVRLRLVYAIVRRRYLRSVPTILDSLQGAPRLYQERVTGILLDLGFELTSFVPYMWDRPEPELQRVFIRLASHIPTVEMQRYVTHLVRSAEPEISHAAFRVLVEQYAESVDFKHYLFQDDDAYVARALEALGKFPSEESVDLALPFLERPDHQDTAVAALTELIHIMPRLTPYVEDHFRDDTHPKIQKGLAQVLATRAEYVVTTMLREEWENPRELMALILQTHSASTVPAMLNRMQAPPRLDLICDLIGETVRSDPWLREEFGTYLVPAVAKRLGIEAKSLSTQRGARSGESYGARTLTAIVTAAVVVPPIVFILLHYFGGSPESVSSVWPSWQEALAGYLSWFETGFIYYALSLHTVYLLVLLAGVAAVIQSARLWTIRPAELFFRHEILPSVSVIAPAYNEEATVVESVRALLNLRYPDYEVIVVNDGSSDGTLERIITTFELERVGLAVESRLRTQSIRGIYRNPRVPRLTVVDKSNGGKADSLNAGINVSRKRYFAAIDADSLLEPDALLHLAAETLHSELPVDAVGGNVLPVNGCSVERGHINRVSVPRNRLARFQMVEYIRSFMTGRTGWARIRSLLIISGAFGLFRKSAVIDVGGYMTSSERMLKDTVAEDMELVVRLARRAGEKGRINGIRYAANANCWTEVPETLKIFASQRDRWQRGLIDVLFFHSSMVFRPRYGRPAFIGMPYHFIFELVGPWIEVQGYLFLAVGLVLGLLPVAVALEVFAVAIGLGVLTSLLSLQLAELRQPLFRGMDRVRLILSAITENFGYRQYANFLRLRGYVSTIRHRTGWGTMTRRGFSSRAPTSRHGKSTPKE